MRRTQNAPGSERRPATAAVAIAITALWHAVLVGWLSTQRPGMRADDPPADAAHAVHVMWLPPRDPARPARSSPTAAAGPRAGAPSQRADQPLELPAPAPAVVPSPADIAIHVVTGDDRWAPTPGEGDTDARIPPRNPLVRIDRSALDIPPRLRVRMRSPQSLQAWLKALAPAGYEADPCPEISRAIAGLATDAAPASRALLEDAVRFEAAYCR